MSLSNNIQHDSMTELGVFFSDRANRKRECSLCKPGCQFEICNKNIRLLLICDFTDFIFIVTNDSKSEQSSCSDSYTEQNSEQMRNLETLVKAVMSHTQTQRNNTDAKIYLWHS